MKHISKIGLLLILVLFIAATMTMPAQAAIFDKDGVVGKDQVLNDDVFLTGKDAVVDGTVNGILFVSGNTVTINGTVNGDVFAIGQTVIVSNTGKVDGNVFAAAQFVTLNGQVTGSVFGGAAALTYGENGQVGRNFFYGGYSFESKQNSVITRSLYTGTYQTILNGEVKQDFHTASGAVEIIGKIGGDAVVDLGESQAGQSRSMGMMPFMNQPGMPPAVQPGLRVADTASIGGKLSYTSSVSQANTIQGVPAGQVVYSTPVPSVSSTQRSAVKINVQPPLLTWFFDFVRNVIALLAFGGLALWLIPTAFQKSVGLAKAKTLTSAGYGLVVVILGYVGAALLLAVTFSVGILLAILTLGALSGPVFGVGLSALGLAFAVFTFLVGTGSKVIVSIMIGQLLMTRAAPDSGNQKFWALLTGTLIYALVRSIPFIGWIFGLAATLIGVGAMWIAYQAYRKSTSALPVAPSV